MSDVEQLISQLEQFGDLPEITDGNAPMDDEKVAEKPSESLEEALENKEENNPEIKEEVNLVNNEGEKQENDPFATKFAALSRKEKMIREREKNMEAKFKEMEAKLAEYEKKKEPETPVETIEDFKRRLLENPDSVFEEVGLSFEALSDAKLNGSLPADVKMKAMEMKFRKQMDEMNKKFETLNKELETKEKTYREQEESRAVENFKNDISRHIVKSDNLDLVRHYDSIGLIDAKTAVFDIVQNHYDSTGEVLAVEDAASQLEDYLVEKSKSLRGISKLSFAEAVEKKESEVKKPSKTLSNDNATGAQQVSADLDKMDQHSAINELIKML